MRVNEGPRRWTMRFHVLKLSRCVWVRTRHTCMTVVRNMPPLSYSPFTGTVSCMTQKKLKQRDRDCMGLQNDVSMDRRQVYQQCCE
jgi:hypothetical protein